MATRHIAQIIDDLDGAVLEEGSSSQVTFSVEGRVYEIDLSPANAEKLKSAFAPYVHAARRVPAGATASRGARQSARSDINLGEVRVWARENGHTVSDRGRVSASVVDAFNAAR